MPVVLVGNGGEGPSFLALITIISLFEKDKGLALKRLCSKRTKSHYSNKLVLIDTKPSWEQRDA